MPHHRGGWTRSRTASGSGLIPLIRFFAVGAASVALRNSIILFAALVLSLVVVPIPSVPLFIRTNVLGLVGPDGSRLLALGFAALGVTLASQAGPALRLGLGGWIRSLPMTAATHRRAMAAALIVPLAPLLVVVLGSVGLTLVAYQSPIDMVRVAGLFCSLGLAGAAGVPVTRWWVGWPVAAAGAVAALSGGIGIAAALALGVVWNLVAGPISVPRHHAGGWHQSPRWLGPMIAWRALGSRMIPATVAPLMLCGAAYLYRVNNHLTVAESAGVTRLAVSMALVVTLAAMADLLVVRRPPWPWARSLPAGSRARVLDDVITMAVPAVPTLLVALGLDRRALLVGLVGLPVLALLAAGAIRRAPGRISRASGEFLITGSAVAVGVTIWPVAALAGLAAIPVLWWHAARADRRLVVTRWQSLHHQAGGDSLAGDAR